MAAAVGTALSGSACTIWGNIEVSDDDSEDDDEVMAMFKGKKKKKQRAPSGSADDDDILASFPPLLLPGAKKTSSDSDDDSDEEVEVVPAVKVNPYLAHHNVVGGLSRDDMKKKLQQMNLKRNEARKLNHQEVAAEQQRLKQPKNQDARQKRAEWELNDKKSRQEAKEAGVDYNRVKLLDQAAEEVDIQNRRKRKKMNPDEGFSNYEAATFRQYKRLTDQMKPQQAEYQLSKQRRPTDEPEFPGAHNLGYGGEGHVSEDKIDHMCEDLDKQEEKRSKFHRRRQHFDEADIDYINERNAQFNKKAERFYGKYTQEIKQNLERGTAI